MIERRSANFPDVVRVEIGKRDDYHTAISHDLPGFFLFDRNLGFLLGQMKDCIKMFYKALYGISVELVESTEENEIFPLKYLSTPIYDNRESA